MLEYKVNNISLSYDGKCVVKDVSPLLPHGKITVLLGPNGSGKSTLLSSLGGLLLPSSGTIKYAGQLLSSLSATKRAQYIAYLTQSPLAPEGMSVRDLVSLGRYPFRRLFKRMSNIDHQYVENALAMCHLTSLADRFLDDLSGGQRQRVWIAMILAQGSDTLLLDEPTTYLDISHQEDVLKLLKHLNMQQRKTIIMVLHDINQAIAYADHIILMKEGDLVAQGEPTTIASEEILEKVYGIKSDVIENPIDGHPLFLPRRDMAALLAGKT